LRNIRIISVFHTYKLRIPGIPIVLQGFLAYSGDFHRTPGIAKILIGFLGIRNPGNPPFPP